MTLDTTIPISLSQNRHKFLPFHADWNGQKRASNKSTIKSKLIIIGANYGSTLFLISASPAKRIVIIKYQSELKRRCSAPTWTASCYEISEALFRFGKFAARNKIRERAQYSYINSKFSKSKCEKLHFLLKEC